MDRNENSDLSILDEEALEAAWERIEREHLLDEEEEKEEKLLSSRKSLFRPPQVKKSFLMRRKDELEKDRPRERLTHGPRAEGGVIGGDTRYLKQGTQDPERDFTHTLVRPRGTPEREPEGTKERAYHSELPEEIAGEEESSIVSEEEPEESPESEEPSHLLIDSSPETPEPSEKSSEESPEFAEFEGSPSEEPEEFRSDEGVEPTEVSGEAQDLVLLQDPQKRQEAREGLRSPVISGTRLSATTDHMNVTWLLTMRGGVKGVFKTEPHSWSKETACEVFSDLLAEKIGMGDIIPPAEFQTYNGQKGSVQYFLSNLEVAADQDDLLYSDDEGIQNDLLRLAIFDVIILNRDRHPGQYGTVMGRVRGIDHGMSLTSTSFGNADIIEHFVDFYVPPEVVEPIKKFLEDEEGITAFLEDPRFDKIGITNKQAVLDRMREVVRVAEEELPIGDMKIDGRLLRRMV